MGYNLFETKLGAEGSSLIIKLLNLSLQCNRIFIFLGNHLEA